VVGPIARLELLPLNGSAGGSDDIIEAHIPAQVFHDLDLQTNETLILTPRKARVFVA
jgi:sulfate transport system ATP-binding protein